MSAPIFRTSPALQRVRPSATLAMLSLILSVAGSTCAAAAAPMVHTQAPGFYRMMLGDFEVTALNDGVVALPVILPKASPEEIRAQLQKMYLTDPIDLSFNAFLVNTGSKLILIDTGMGGVLREARGWYGAGHLIANLRAAGYQPEQIDEIYITHTHPDHVGGLIAGNQRAFPNAMVRAARSEVEVFLEPAKTAAALATLPNRDQVKARFQTITDLLVPYVESGKFRTFEEDIQLVPGIRALATHGHTPGHTSYLVESKGQTLIVLGDLVHVGAVQFPNPRVNASSDADPQAASFERSRIFRLAAERAYWVAAAHLAFPGLGHIRAEEDSYSWVPGNYVIPR